MDPENNHVTSIRNYMGRILLHITVQNNEHEGILLIRLQMPTLFGILTAQLQLSWNYGQNQLFRQLFRRDR
jgi:hypothetical protein